MTRTFLGYSVAATAFLVSLRQAIACSPLPGQPLGPFFHVFPTSPVDPVIKTVPDNPNIVVGEVQLFAGGSYSPYATVNVTIDVLTGSITEGWPSGVGSTSPPPILSPDPSGGYELQAVEGNRFALIDPEGLSQEFDLPVPDDSFSILDVGQRVYYFVSTEMNLAFIMYEAESNPCTTPTDIEACRVALYLSIDLDSGMTRHSGVFDAPRGVVVFQPGPFNSLEIVYDSPLPVASLGALDSCGGTGWLRFTTDGTIESLLRFDPGRVEAVAGDWTAYRVVQDDQFFFNPGDEPTRYVESVRLELVDMVSGAILATIPLNTSEFWGLVNVDPPFTLPTPTDEETAAPAPNSGIVVPFPPVTNLPTISPVTSNVGGSAMTVKPSTNTPTPSPVGDLTPLSAAPIPSTLSTGGTTLTEAPISDAPTSTAPISEAPAATPRIETTAPIFPVDDVVRDCQANDACSMLAGSCCPTLDSVLLQCCNMGSVELTCASNPTCDSLGLEGACCPTPTGVYLDCCTVVPDECGLDEDSSCQVVSALEYRREQEQAAATSASTYKATVGTFLMSVAVLLWIA